MADFDPNPRGGLNTNRESLHASAEYRRQVSALEQMKESEMAEKMTLEQVRDWHLARDSEQRIVGFNLGATNHRGMADAIDAHLAQPAQAVDVGAIREVIAYLKIGHRFDTDMADKLTRAIDNAQADD